MGYDRNPRDTRGGYDERERQNYGRENEPWGGGGWNPGDSYGSPNQAYGARQDRSDGDHHDQQRYRRDGGFQGRGASGTGNFGSNVYSGNERGHDRYGQNDRGSAQRGDYGRQPQGYDYDERGFFDRAGDEVRSWFGDDEANRRRDLDARNDQQRYGSGSDDHYHDWRRGQIAALDRDYDEYRRESRTKFDNEFGGWRSQRQGQRDSLSKVEEHMDVVGSDGGHVGTVDKVRGDRIVLTKSDSDAGGRHHSIPSRWITTVDTRVTIDKTADEAHRQWRDEERNRAFFNEDGSHTDDRQSGGDRTGGDAANGPHVLGRSFSGTY